MTISFVINNPYIQVIIVERAEGLE